MRICMLSELFYPYLLGGAERRYWEIAKRLAKRGHEVTVISLRFPGYPDEEVVEGIKIVRVGSEHPLTHRNARKLPSYWRAGFRALKSRFDIVDANQGAATFVGLWKLFRLTKRPVVLTFHDIYWRNWPGYWGRAGHILGGMLELGWSVMARAASKVITNSNQTKEKLDVFGPSNTQVIVSGVDFDMIKSIKPGKPSHTIVYVGRLEPYKHVDILIEAMAHSPKLKKYRLVVMGSGPDQERLKLLANKNKVKVEFLGFVPEEEKLKRMKGADIIVNPSFVEGLGLILLEGMACGVPVVGFDLKCYQEFCKDSNSVLIQERTPEAMSKALERILGDSKLYKKLSKEGLVTAEQFSWESVTDRVEKLYEGLLE